MYVCYSAVGGVFYRRRRRSALVFFTVVITSSKDLNGSTSQEEYIDMHASRE